LSGNIPKRNRQGASVRNVINVIALICLAAAFAAYLKWGVR
jgi:hypothetical protein